MIKNAYLILKQTLEAAVTVGEVDYWLGQYLQNGESVWHVSDGVYIEFMEIPTEQLGGNAQLLQTRVRIHVAQECVYDDGSRITDATVNHLQMCEDVYKVLNGRDFYLSLLAAFAALAGTANDRIVINTMSRTQITPDHTLSNRLVTVQEFSCTIYDYTAMLELITKQASLVVNAAIP
jgi:hypothetical protein